MRHRGRAARQRGRPVGAEGLGHALRAQRERRPGRRVLELHHVRRLRLRDRAAQRRSRLGQPALDVLSLVAYRQPVAKADVEKVTETALSPMPANFDI